MESKIDRYDYMASNAKVVLFVEQRNELGAHIMISKSKQTILCKPQQIHTAIISLSRFGVGAENPMIVFVVWHPRNALARPHLVRSKCKCIANRMCSSLIPFQLWCVQIKINLNICGQCCALLGCSDDGLLNFAKQKNWHNRRLSASNEFVNRFVSGCCGASRCTFQLHSLLSVFKWATTRSETTKWKHISSYRALLSNGYSPRQRCTDFVHWISNAYTILCAPLTHNQCTSVRFSSNVQQKFIAQDCK